MRLLILWKQIILGTSHAKNDDEPWALRFVERDRIHEGERILVHGNFNETTIFRKFVQSESIE